MGRIQRPYALLLVRALLLGVQLSPILFAADVVLTESCRFMCTCFEFVGLHDTTWLDTVVSCTVDLSLDALASRGSSRRSLAPKHECNAFYNAILTPQHLDAHLLLLLAGGATSLVCWCTLFAFLAWLGAVKARLLRRIISRRWWRAKRALLHQPNNGTRPTPTLRAWLTLALPARMGRWYAEWLTLLVDELKVRTTTLALFHAAVRIVPGMGTRKHLTLAHPALLLHQLSWRGALTGLTLLARRRLAPRPRPWRASTHAHTPQRRRRPSPDVVLDQRPPSPRLLCHSASAARAPPQPLSWALPHAHSAPSELLSGLGSPRGSPPQFPRKKGEPHAGSDDDGAVSSRLIVEESGSELQQRRVDDGRQAMAPPSPAAVAGAAFSSAVGVHPDALGEGLELVVVPVLYGAQFVTRLVVALVVQQLEPCIGRWPCWVWWWQGAVGYMMLFWPINGGLLLLVAAAQAATSLAGKRSAAADKPMAARRLCA